MNNLFDFTAEEVAKVVKKTSKLMKCDYLSAWENHTHTLIKMSVKWEDVKKILYQDS